MGAVPGGREAYPAGQPHSLEPQLEAESASFDLFTEFTDHLSVRKILQSERAGRGPDRAHGAGKHRVHHLPCGFLDLCWGDCLNPSTSAHLGRWLAGLAAGVAWLNTWYAPIPTRIGALLEVLVLWGLGGAFRKRASQKAA